MSPIQILPEAHHRRRISNIPNANTPTHKAVLLDMDGNEFTAVVKAPAPGSNGLFRESHGHAYHKECGLPVSERGCIVIVPMTKLRTYHPDVEWMHTRKDPEWLCWASEMPSNAVLPYLAWKQNALLEASSDLPGLIALRDALHDVDSDPANFIPTDHQEMIAADFSGTFGGAGFDLTQLSDLRFPLSKLAMATWRQLDDEKRSMLQARGAIHQLAHRRVDQGLRMLRGMLIRDSQIRTAVNAFLNERMSEEWTRRRWAR